MYKTLDEAIKAKGEAFVLSAVNARLKQYQYNKDRQKEARMVYAAFKAGEVSYGGTRVDMGTGEAVEE